MASKKPLTKDSPGNGPTRTFRNRRRTDIYAEYSQVRPEILIKCLDAVAREGGALRFGISRDGGAYSIGIYGDGEPYTEWIGVNDGINEFLEELADYFEDRAIVEAAERVKKDK